VGRVDGRAFRRVYGQLGMGETMAEGARGGGIARRVSAHTVRLFRQRSFQAPDIRWSTLSSPQDPEGQPQTPFDEAGFARAAKA